MLHMSSISVMSLIVNSHQIMYKYTPFSCWDLVVASILPRLDARYVGKSKLAKRSILVNLNNRLLAGKHSIIMSSS